MNVGLYSFKTFEFSKIEYLKKIIYQIMGRKCGIYIYSENTRKERLSKRDGLRKMLEDYRESKINIIFFEDREALGSDEYTSYRVLKILSDEKVNYTSLKDGLNNTSYGKLQMELIGVFENYAKKASDERSRRGQMFKERQKQLNKY